MHCYEVIPEGTVCKLYFDLEFYKPANKGADGKIMVSRLIRVCCYIFYFLICYCQNRLLHTQQPLHYLSDLLFIYFFKALKPQLNLFWGICSMFVTSWWKFMESHVPPATSWTLTPVQRRSSVGISSSISKMQFSKTTYMWVRSMLSKGNFWWHVLKSYSLCCLGRFIHAILQPILSTLKGGRSHNSGVNSSEMRSGFQISPLKHCFFAINTWGLLFLISELTAEHLTSLEANQQRH